jgi:TetR/AcrR family transcriptional regulator
MIWATTQHYADFDAQIRALCGERRNACFETASETLKTVFLKGLIP